MDENKINLKMGKILHDLRLKKGFSQEKLAQLANSHRNYIGRIERGEQSPTVSFWFKLANALETKLSDIILMVES